MKYLRAFRYIFAMYRTWRMEVWRIRLSARLIHYEAFKKSPWSMAFTTENAIKEKLHRKMAHAQYKLEVHHQMSVHHRVRLKGKGPSLLPKAEVFE